jgi:hypothetical protein
LRQAKKLGVLGLAVLALVAAFGLLAGSVGSVHAMPATQAVTTTFNNCVPQTTPSTGTTCTGVTSQAVAPGGTLTITLTTPGVTIVGAGPITGCGPATTITATTVVYGPCGPGTPAGTNVSLTFAVPAGVTLITTTVAYGGTAGGGTPGNCTAVTNGSATTSSLMTTQCLNIIPTTVTGPGGTVTLTIQCNLPNTVCQAIAPTPTVLGTCPLTTPLPQAGGGGGGAGPITLTYTCGAGQSVPAGTNAAASVQANVPPATGWQPIETTFANAVTNDTWNFPLAGSTALDPASKTCAGVGGTAVNAGGQDICVITTLVAIPAGATLQVTILTPTGTTGFTCTTAGAVAGITAATVAPAAPGGGSTCVFTNTTAATIPAGSVVGTETFTVPVTTPGGTTVTQSGTICLVATVPCPAGSLVVGPGPVLVSGLGATIGGVGPGPNQPTNETKFCNNTTTAQGLSQTIPVVTTQPLSVAGPATSFTLPLIGPAATCYLQVQRGPVSGTGVVGAAAPCDLANNRCADGYVQLTLSTGSGAAISCANGFAGFTATTIAGVPALPTNGGTCQQQVVNTQLNIPCGTTAGTAAANTTINASCVGVLFDIQSLVAACLTTPNFCLNNGTGLGIGTGFNLNTGASATVTVQFFATPANGGPVGGIQLGTNTFSFVAPGIGALLVTANPQLIPSNGTVASVVTASFACNNGFNLFNGFPLSSNGQTLQIANGGNLLGVNALVVNNNSIACGAGLPGTFTFTTPGPILFDNGRSSESVTCGPNANVNLFGNGQPAFFGGVGTTFPLAFTCTGAAVLAIGAGVAGDAPINVSYQSAVGGLTAVGSTLISVSPSGVPRISVACNPNVISAGSTGSLCTATVTDINGIPLSGVTGATVTFTTSDPTTTTILPCVIGTPGTFNITTTPQVIPLVTPNTPCVTPSTTIPGQVNTFINGQATALLVASATAHPETVTVTASLGVLIPPAFACLVSPYLPSGFGVTPNAAGYYAPINGTGLPGVQGCGTASPIGTSGLATALNVAGGGLTGIVTLPNTTSASTTVTIGGPAGILVAGATPISPLVLSRGCNSVIITSYVGTPVANIAALVSPANAVVSIWRFNNGTKLFNAGFFSDPNAPVDFVTTGSTSTTTAPNAASTIIAAPTYSPATGALTSTANNITETYYVCVNQSATMASG